jgi:hypothetical protein
VALLPTVGGLTSVCIPVQHRKRLTDSPNALHLGERAMPREDGIVES